ncbi:telomerase protein component 1 [Zygosaccharomyces mellis]|uniref:phosphatidylinositol-3,4,5-trisphosphate 3-phosphatase n=1 Tax=Zygosaccharomyces mellis TaxID=42258 RepID=A0A4C2E814_9SACH|nr:telomerase protein component 1 [Zygosaccharomyces mellis]
MTIRIHYQAKPTNLLKSIYATPLNVHKNKSGLTLDLSYITDQIIVCSYPVTRYPKLMYRNSLEDLVTFLNTQHGPKNWKIYNFKIERGRSDYQDEELMHVVRAQETRYLSCDFDDSTLTAELGQFLNRVGWMDHSPPPFLLLQNIIDDIHCQLLKSGSSVVVLHCKMGKGRSGTICIAYLMKYLESPLSESRDTFMNGRFKPGVSRGVTIFSQLRCLRYHEMFLYYEPDLRPDILYQMSKSKFKVHTIQLKDPSNILFSRPCSACIRIQTYNEFRDSVADLTTLKIEEGLLSQSDNDKTITIHSPLELYISDIRLEFSISTRSPAIINNFTTLASYAHCWLNLYWETLKCSRIDSKHHYMLSKLLCEQDNGQNFDFVIKWNELDGTGGTSNRGLKLFESLKMRWSLIL